MRKILLLIFTGALLATAGSSCNDDDWDTYRDYRLANQNWYNQQAYRQNPDGTPYYTELSPRWCPNSGVLIHYFNDRAETEGNLSPLQTSVTATKYYLSDYQGTPYDSSYLLVDSLYISTVSANIAGWQVALNDMRVGDSCEVIIPWLLGYGSSGSAAISPYTVLKFNIKLEDIPYYEVPQY